MTIHDSGPGAKPKKRTFHIAIVIILLATVLIIASAVIIYFSGALEFSMDPFASNSPGSSPIVTLEPEKYSTATEVREHLVIKNMKDNSTSSHLIMLDALAGKIAKVGSQFSIEIPYHNGGDGVLNIVNIACNTSGFSLVGISPTLPVTLPNTASTEAGNVTLRITFASPSEQYVGTFDFTVFYEYFPL
jgi:hypothetical protein